MNRTQIIFISGGAALLAVLLFFGTTVPEKVMQPELPKVTSFDINSYLEASKKKLTASQLAEIARFEKLSSENTSPDQQAKAFNQLAKYWEDSLHNREAAVFYINKSAVLVNSEKNLTFAAQQILDNLRNENDVAKRGWKALQAVELFEKAIELNPNNDDLKIGLGSCYIFGKGMAGDAQETMKGVQQLLQVVRKDSSNMKAQMVLGIGGVISTQYDKAVNRLLIVLKNDPNNVEAMSWLADAYAGKGDKENALKWYDVTKRIVNNPKYSKEVDERIKSLKEKMPD